MYKYYIKTHYGKYKEVSELYFFKFLEFVRETIDLPEEEKEEYITKNIIYIDKKEIV